MQAVLNQTAIWVERVPSKENISDSPSREDYSLMREMVPPAVWRKPLIAKLYKDIRLPDEEPAAALCDSYM